MQKNSLPVSVALSSSYGVIFLTLRDNICCTTGAGCCYDMVFITVTISTWEHHGF